MKKIPILYGLMLIFSVVSCAGEFDYSREEVNVLKIESRTLLFDQTASTQKLSVSSEVDWTVSEESEWLSVDKLPDGISVSVTANPTIVEREGILNIAVSNRTAEVKVVQDGLLPSFSASKELVPIVSGGENVTINIQSNVDWEAKTHCDWMALTKTQSGLSVAVPENLTDKRRTANVDFYNSGCRFARIIVSQASSVPQPTDYYSVDMSSVKWSDTYVHYIKDEKGKLLAVLAKESVDGVSTTIQMYPAPSGVQSFSAPSTVTSDMMYVKNDGTMLFSEDPRVGFEEMESAVLEPLVLVSDVKTHGAVKVGQQIWLAEDYKTTEFVDGTSIPSYVNGDAFWAAGDAAVVVHKEHYMYSAYALGWDDKVFDDSNFAPQGWAVPDETQYQTLLKTTGENLNNLLDGAAYLFGATNNLKATPSSSKVKVAALNYTNTWTCVPTAKKDKIMMDGIKPDGTVVSSGQDPKNAFSVRLIKK